MNMKQYRYVLVLANEGSFSRAAESLNISQPSLSQYVKKIEGELGAALFDRSGAQLRLTEAGRVYIDTGRRMLDLERSMQNRLSDLTEYKSGSISIGVSPFRSQCIMPQAADLFRQKYPGMYLIVDERVGYELLDGAQRGDFDLCITTLPVNERVFSFEQIMKEEIVLAVPSDSDVCEQLEKCAEKLSDRRYPAVDIRLLDGCDFVMLEDTQRMQQLLAELCDDYKISLHKSVECRSIEAQLAMVRAGMGMAFVPSSAKSVRTEDRCITRFSVSQQLPQREIAVIWRRGQHHAKAVCDLLDIFKNINSHT